MVRTWEEVILTIRTFLKLKITFCKYWTSIKIEISITCLYKEYEVKIKIVHERWLQLKMKLLLIYNNKITFEWGQINLWWMESTGEIFPGGGMSKFLTGEGDFPPSSQRGKLCEVI